MMSKKIILKNIMRFSYNRLVPIIISILFVFSQMSCKKLVEIPAPFNSIAENNVFTNDVSAISAVNGIYVRMCNANSGPFTGNTSISLLTGLSADELTLYSGGVNTSREGYYRNALTVTGTVVSGPEFWGQLYKFVFYCNGVIEGLSDFKATALTPAIKQQLLGEAKFMRAYYYFYLVNLFGDVPLALTTDAKINTLLARSSKTLVYEQIIRDLIDAKALLSSDYLNETLLSLSNERVRPTKWAAIALLARTYLYKGDYTNADIEASSVISNPNFALSTLNNVFLKKSLGNNEAIWQVQPTQVGWNTLEALTYVITSAGTGLLKPVYLSNHLMNSFEPDDQRAKPKNWIDTITVLGTFYRFPYKYKTNIASDPSINATTGSANMKEFLMMLRLGEQYLIRSEARAHLNNLAGAIADLDMIRQRAGLSLIANTNPGISPAVLLDKILHERQAELFTEFGHRWMDLKRTGKIDEVMSLVTPVKSSGASWQSYQQWYPIHLGELANAPNLTQTPGY